MAVRLITVLITLWLGGCVEFREVSQLLLPSRADLVSIAKNPQYAPNVIQASLGGRKAVLVRASEIEGAILWKGNGGEALVTRGGRLVQLLGIETELRGYHSTNADPLVTGVFASSVRHHARSDVMPNYRYGLRSQSVFQLGKRAVHTVLGVKKTLRKVTEQVTFYPAGKTRTNTHWVDQTTGLVWKTTQHYSPYSKPITLERVFITTTRLPLAVPKQPDKNWKPGL